MVGTGGTAVTLAAILHGIPESDFDTKINGRALRKHDIEKLFNTIKKMAQHERLTIKGLEPGREDTILPGTLAVLKLMDYFEKDDIIISYTDLLEGILIQHMEGENHG